MAVCKFYLNGGCKFGNKCRFEHPNERREPGRDYHPSHGNNSNSHHSGQQNRFAPIGNGNRNDAPPSNPRFGGGGQHPSNARGGGGFQGGRGGFQGGGGGRRNNNTRFEKYGVTGEDVAEDLKDRPNWIMSCYAPTKNVPINLWGGDIEQSPEELRAHAYLCVQNTGNLQGYVTLENQMAAMANTMFQRAEADPEGALHYISDAESQHPNRFDETRFERSKYPLFSVDNYNRRRGVFEHIPDDRKKGRGNRFQQAQTGAFGQQPPTGFGQAQTPNAFSGQPSGPAFGQPAPSQPAFGQNSFASGAGAQPAFGQPSFGQPAFGQAQPPVTPAFGAQQQPVNEAFPNTQNIGQPMDPGFPNNTNGGFGAQQQNTNGGFGAPQPAFGAPQQPAAAPMQPGGFQLNAQNQQQQPSQAAGGFGVQQQPGFGAQAPFNNMANGGNPATGPGTGSNVPQGSDSANAYSFLVQNGQFQNGVIPETAPDDQFLVL